jgi:aldehyde:ferredoxin oxidoreductase
MSHGYAGKILWVDLTRNEIRTEPIEKWCPWIGGRGIGSSLLSQIPELKSEYPADQPIVFSAGPLVGTGIPLGTRTAVSARNLVSGGFCYSNVGGDFGARMKMAGYDVIIIQGKSKQPVLLYLNESGAQILPADVYWGKQISEFQESLYETYAKIETSFIAIGPAGEREAAISCLLVDQAHAAGWGGSGALFGAKKLKAIVASGSRHIPVFDEEGLRRKIKQLEWRISASEKAAALISGGTHALAGAGGLSKLGPTAVNNIQDEFLSVEESAPLREETFRQWETSRRGCIGCSVRCLHYYEMDSEKHGALKVEGMHANSVRGLATNLGVNDAEDLLISHYLCNEYGLDIDGVSAAAAFALECSENGLLKTEQPGGVRLEWGDGASMVKLIRQMGERTGLGELLSRGVQEAARQIGKGSEQYAMTVKGVGINEGGLRSHKAWSLGIMTSTRGGGHLGGAPQTEQSHMSAQVGRRLFKNPEAGIPESYLGKGSLVAWTEGIKAIIDSLGLCYLIYAWGDLSIGHIEELAEMLYLTTGNQISGEELHQIGLRIHTIERYLSYLLGGYQREDDTFPDRFFDTPIASGPHKGAYLDRASVEKELDEYYAALGWDVASGLPTKEQLAQMGLCFPELELH